MSEKRILHRKKLPTGMKIFLPFLAALILFRLYLPALAKHWITRELNRDPLYHGQIDDVRLHIWRGAYSIDRLRIEKVEGQKEFPILESKEIEIGVSWAELFHERAILAELTLRGLWVNFTREPTAKGTRVQIGSSTEKGRKKEVHDWKSTFQKLVPLDVGRLDVDGDSIHFLDLTTQPRVDIYIDQLKIFGRNLTNSERFSSSLFGTIDLSGRLMKSGSVHIVLTFNPWVSPPLSHENVDIKGLNLVDLNNFFTAYGSFDVKAGSFDLTFESATANGNVKGFALPMVHGLKVTDFKIDKKKGLIHVAWEDIVGAIGWVFKNFPAKQQAAKIPFEGRLEDPEVDHWETFKSVFYNMFVRPISPKLEHSVKIQDVSKKKKKKKMEKKKKWHLAT